MRAPISRICAWCSAPITLSQARTRLSRVGTQGGPGIHLALFHAACADAILDICEGEAIGAKARPRREVDAPPPSRPAPKIPFAGQDDGRSVAPSVPKRPVASVAPSAAEIHALAARGFAVQQIAARLRAPYAAVEAALATRSTTAHPRTR